jgi:putative oxygen-independent coproporphyrinogen III oxidase
VKLAQDAGFDNINLDLMYALPEQTLAMAERDLVRAFALQPTHVSHYQLTLEPNTIFAAKPPQGIPDDDASWDMQEHCQALLAANGYTQYEVSAYARPDRQCAHNLNYWRYGDYLGIGAGAHGKLTLGHDQSILRRWKHKHPGAYLAHAGKPDAIGGDERVAPERRPFEFMLNALRLVDGFDLKLFSARTGLGLDTIAPQLQQAESNGWLAIQDSHARPTDAGRRFNNDLVSLFL